MEYIWNTLRNRRKTSEGHLSEEHLLWGTRNCALSDFVDQHGAFYSHSSSRENITLIALKFQHCCLYWNEILCSFAGLTEQFNSRSGHVLTSSTKAGCSEVQKQHQQEKEREARRTKKSCENPVGKKTNSLISLIAALSSSFGRGFKAGVSLNKH